MDARSLKGIAVVSIEDGEKVGTVDDMIFNLETMQVLAFRLSRTGFFRSAGELVAMEDVESLGKDAVMIRNRDVLREEKSEREFQDRPDLKSFGNLRVVTQDGSYVGDLATVHIDQKTGSVTELEVSGGSLFAMLRRNLEVPASEVISIGNDVVVISDHYAAAEAGPEEEPGEEADPGRSQILQ